MPDPSAGPRSRLPILLFLGSGFSALVYQVVWARAAGLVLGNTTAAVGTVVAVFMGGLAVGSAWGGRLAARGRPLRLYGLLEIAIGVLGLAVPWLFRLVEPLHAATYGTGFFAAARFLSCAVILLPATVMMGVTLPVLVRHADRAGGAGDLYAANSAGAALGALAAGLLLVPQLGLLVSTFIAVAVNLVVGGLALFLSPRRPLASTAPPTASAEGPTTPLTPSRKTALAVYALSGFSGLVCEIAWTRAITLAVGSTIHAFTLILFCFILGLAVGSALAARPAWRNRPPLAVAGVLQAALALWGAALVVMLARLPVRLADLILLLNDSFPLMLLAEGAVILGLILPPAVFMGAMLPVTMAAFRETGDEGARAAGRVCAWNTWAAIAGSLGGSFLFIPALGLDGTLRLAAGVNLIAALACAWTTLPARRVAVVGAAAGVGLVITLLPRWDAAISSSGLFLYAPGLENRALAAGRSVDDVLHEEQIEFATWDSYGLTTIHRAPDGGRFLRVNGKTDASTYEADMATQSLLAHIPMALHEDPERVLVIGLGIGVTLSTVQAYDPVAIDCVEISPGVRRAAARFPEINRNALDHPGTRILVGDGRAHVRYTAERYDVIVSEPSNLWISGMANLFTREFFLEARSRLKPGGLFSQWIHVYGLSRDDFRGVVKTFLTAFPNAMLFETDQVGDYLLLGSVEPRRFDAARIVERTGRPGPAGRLDGMGFRDAAPLMACYVAGPSTLRTIARGGRLIRDDDCWIEYSAPRAMLTGRAGSVIAMFLAHRRSAAEILAEGPAKERLKARLTRYAASRLSLCRLKLSMAGDDPERVRRRLRQVLELNPEDPWTRRLADSIKPD